MTQYQEHNPANSLLRSEYQSRINRVMDYIDAEIDGDLSLKNLSAIAHFSPYHFHRIFHAMTGETLSRYIQRIRIEKAASLLVINPKKTITGISSSLCPPHRAVQR
ncbi:helix-turn-helix domain-containing protein [Candidatus Latescibacterota bacterium]